MNRGVPDQLGMKGRPDDCVLLDKNRIAVVQGKNFDTLSDIGDFRRPNEDGLDLFHAGDLRRYDCAKTVDLSAVGVAFHRNVQKAEPRLSASLDSGREQNESRAGAENRRAVADFSDQPIDQAEADQKAPHDGAFAAGEDKGLRLFNI